LGFSQSDSIDVFLESEMLKRNIPGLQLAIIKKRGDCKNRKLWAGKYADPESNFREAIGIYKANSQTKTGDLANALRGFALVLEKRSKVSEAKRQAM